MASRLWTEPRIRAEISGLPHSSFFFFFLLWTVSVWAGLALHNNTQVEMLTFVSQLHSLCSWGRLHASKSTSYFKICNLWSAHAQQASFMDAVCSAPPSFPFWFWLHCSLAQHTQRKCWSCWILSKERYHNKHAVSIADLIRFLPVL